MANIQISENFFGGYTAKVPDQSTELSLSFADRQVMQQIASTTAREGTLTRRAIESLSYDLDGIADAVVHLESEIGLRLDKQTELLRNQLELLHQVRDAVLTPSKTRAAERAADAATLLDRKRFDRALQVAKEGIEADPNNPAVFFAAGWAYAGLNDAANAQSMFEEAREAANGDECSLAARRAARAALIGKRYDVAYALVRDARAVAQSPAERAALAYDIAICAFAVDDVEAAEDALRDACSYNSTYSTMALMDQAFAEAPTLHEVASEVLLNFQERVAQARKEAETALEDAASQVPSKPQFRHAFQQLASSLRPEHDAAFSYRTLTAELAAGRAYLESSSSQPSLQESLGLLNDARCTAARVRELVPKVEQHIAGQQEAETRQNAVTETKDAATKEKQTAAEVASRLRRLRAFQRHWFLAAVGLIILGLMSSMTVALIVAALGVSGLVALKSYESQINKAAHREAEAESELQAHAYDENGGAAPTGIRFARLGAYSASVRELRVAAEKAARDGDPRAELEARLWSADSLIRLEKASEAIPQAERALAIARSNEDPDAESNASTLLARARASTRQIT